MAENDIEKTIQSVLRFARCDQQVQQHRLIPECQPVSPFVYDDGRIKQVLINLIRNATQAMEVPGDIHIRSLMDPDNPQMVCVVVADQGVGIPADIQDKIWEPFFSTKDEGGTGLGLDVCKGIIQSHEGTIFCESQPGVGTTMTVRLPLKKK